MTSHSKIAQFNWERTGRFALPAETSGVRKRILDISQAKTRQTIEAVLKIYMLFVYEDTRYLLILGNAL